MKKISFLGDSILMIGYGNPVKEALSDRYNVFIPDTNARFTQNTLRMLKDFRQDLEGSDVIHWNNGLWDHVELFGDGAFTPLDMYTANIMRIAGILKKYARKVIFATTAPVHPDFPYHNMERTKLYNDTVVPLLEKEGILINDLFSVMLPHRIDGIAEDLVHLNPLGIELCKNSTLRIIEKALEE